MSKVKISGNASGTGTFTIAAPNSNTDRTLTLPDEAGTVLTSASSVATSQLPSQLSISSSASAGSLALDASGRVTMPYQPCAVVSNTATGSGTITGGTVAIDRTSMYNGTNGRFTAPVSGAYFCSIVVYGNSTDTFELFVYTNGFGGHALFQKNWTGGSYEGQSGSVIISLSAGDYIEFRNGKGNIRGATTDFRCVYLLS